jgi:hypothetical protein
MTVTDEEIRAVYREEGAIRRTSRRLLISEDRIAAVIADIRDEVSGKRRSMGATLMNQRRQATRVARAMMRSSWRCYECLARAKGDACANGHPAPWVDLKAPH